MSSADCDSLMQAWFPFVTQKEQKVLHETDIREIAEVLLRYSKTTWSRIPRIYSILRIINKLEAIESFLEEGCTDTWLPFSQKTLPSAFQCQSARKAFLDTQELVFDTKAIGLEQENTRHRHFRDASQIPFRKTGELGQGGFGSVDRVVSTVTHKEYARKLLLRGRTFKKNREVLLAFERELSSLKRLFRHRHVVDFVGSYTDPKYVAIITSPVADCNLHDYLARDLDAGRKSFLRTFFGCLTSALCFLHDSRVRHKDIKPQNILVKDEHVFLTDFGLALDWNELTRNTTVGPAWQTPRYGAPEVADGSARNESADIWSLGCVFLEIFTVLNGEKVQSLHNYMINNGEKRSPYYANMSGVKLWIAYIKNMPGLAVDKVPTTWVAQMLLHDRQARLSAHDLEECIHEHANEPAAIFAFAGRCCLDDDETEATVLSSTDEAAEDSTTHRYDTDGDPVKKKSSTAARSVEISTSSSVVTDRSRELSTTQQTVTLPNAEHEQERKGNPQKGIASFSTYGNEGSRRVLDGNSGEHSLSRPWPSSQYAAARGGSDYTVPELQPDVESSASKRTIAQSMLSPAGTHTKLKSVHLAPSQPRPKDDKDRDALLSIDRKNALHQAYVEDDDSSSSHELSNGGRADQPPEGPTAHEEQSRKDWVFFSTGSNVKSSYGPNEFSSELTEENLSRVPSAPYCTSPTDDTRAVFGGIQASHLIDVSDFDDDTVRPLDETLLRRRHNQMCDCSRRELEEYLECPRRVHRRHAARAGMFFADADNRRSPVKSTHGMPGQASGHTRPEAVPRRSSVRPRETARGIPRIIDWERPSFTHQSSPPPDMRLPPQRHSTRRAERPSPPPPSSRSATMPLDVSLEASRSRREARKEPSRSGFRDEPNSSPERDPYPTIPAPGLTTRANSSYTSAERGTAVPERPSHYTILRKPQRTRNGKQREHGTGYTSSEPDDYPRASRLHSKNQSKGRKQAARVLPMRDKEPVTAPNPPRFTDSDTDKREGNSRRPKPLYQSTFVY